MNYRSHKQKINRMNKLGFMSLPALLALVCLGVSGCYTPPQADANARRFQESESVNVVFRFYQWDNVCIVQPEYREQGYLRYMNSNNLNGALDDLHVPRDTAVVLMGWNYGPGEIIQNAEKWKAILASHGFRRVVCLRDNEVEKLNGLAVLSDWQRPVEQAKQTAGL